MAKETVETLCQKAQQALSAGNNELARQVYLQALGLTTQAKQGAFFTAAVRRAHVTVDPRYGRWNPNQGVCPPTGCNSGASAASTADTSPRYGALP